MEKQISNLIWTEIGIKLSYPVFNQRAKIRARVSSITVFDRLLDYCFSKAKTRFQCDTVKTVSFFRTY